jgi:archaellum component FlaC
MKMVPIEGKDGYFRDTHSNAVINKNENDFNAYVTNRQKLTTDKERINDIENELGNIKGDLSDIKTMLQHFMDKHK